jgi:hypothetical protein
VIVEAKAGPWQAIDHSCPEFLSVENVQCTITSAGRHLPVYVVVPRCWRPLHITVVYNAEFGERMPLKAFTSPPLGRAASDRLDKASRNSPALKFGERDSDGVRALQSALLLLEDPAIDIPAGVTGNFLDQTAAAVKAFQKRNRLAVDGVAGRQTITLLDSIMAHRGQRSLQRLDRVLVDLRRQYSDDVEREKILREMELKLSTIRRGNELGFAIALPVVALT